MIINGVMGCRCDGGWSGRRCDVDTCADGESFMYFNALTHIENYCELT